MEYKKLVSSQEKRSVSNLKSYSSLSFVDNRCSKVMQQKLIHGIQSSTGSVVQGNNVIQKYHHLNATVLARATSRNLFLAQVNPGINSIYGTTVPALSKVVLANNIVEEFLNCRLTPNDTNPEQWFRHAHTTTLQIGRHSSRNIYREQAQIQFSPEQPNTRNVHWTVPTRMIPVNMQYMQPTIFYQVSYKNMGGINALVADIKAMGTHAGFLPAAHARNVYETTVGDISLQQYP